MSRSDEQIKELLKACRDEKSLDDIVSRNKTLVEYTGKELDDMEDIPDWEYLMSAAQKQYDEYVEEFENGTYEWDLFDYGPDRFMVWSRLSDLIEGLKEQEKIDASYE